MIARSVWAGLALLLLMCCWPMLWCWGLVGGGGRAGGGGAGSRLRQAPSRSLSLCKEVLVLVHIHRLPLGVPLVFLGRGDERVLGGVRPPRGCPPKDHVLGLDLRIRRLAAGFAGRAVGPSALFRTPLPPPAAGVSHGVLQGRGEVQIRPGGLSLGSFRDFVRCESASKSESTFNKALVTLVDHAWNHDLTSLNVH